MIERMTGRELARAFVTLGYPRQQIEDALRANYPGEPVDEYIRDAEQTHEGLIAGLDAAASEDEQAAVEAEHDLSRTMRRHDPES